MSGAAKSGKMQYKTTIQQRLFIYAMIRNCGRRTQSAKEAGYRHPTQAGSNLTNPKINPIVVRELEEKMAELEAKSELTAEYVRNYIFNILDFKPADFFEPSTDGGWEISEEGYNNLPEGIKKAIEEVELKEIKIGAGEHTRTIRMLWVRFVSKTTAMTTAAKYTLTQKIQAQAEASIDYDDVLKRVAEKRAAKKVQSRIDEVKAQALPLALPAPKVPSSNGTNGVH